MAFSTPLVIRAAGLDQVISPGGNLAGAYQLESGEMLWWIEYDGYSLVPRPVFGHGLVYIMSGYNRPLLFAVRPDGRGNVTKTHVAWTQERGVSLTASPLLVGEDLYMVSDKGIATCLDAKTGEERWRSRLGGEFSASPLYADGRIYFLNETGTSIVIRPGAEFEKLAENQVDGRTLASLAPADGAIFLRTDTHLYRFEDLGKR
jgi:outer membrane protein assembly factor BamB